MDCSVCCETVRCTKCPYCNFASCVECTSTFLLGLTKDAHCMNCNKLWNRGVLLDVLPKSFVNGKYRSHRENILFEREKCLFPAMQTIISREKMFMDLCVLAREARVAHDTVMYQEITETISRLRTDKSTKKKTTVVRKCPVDGCQGFVSSKWKCGLCLNHICKDCNEIVCEGHECDPSVVETMKLIKKDTKPCPTCGEMIFKASGCSQMWCTSCHAVFDWNTMQLETGIIHNPHYYEFQRKNGTLQRHPLDACDDIPEYLHFFNKFGDTGGTIARVHMLHYHLVDYLRTVRVADDLHYTNRKKFMLNEISEQQFKNRIQRMEKAREKIRDVNDILGMFRDVLKDSLMQLYRETCTVPEFKTMISNLFVYVNDSLKKVKVLYDNCVMQFVDLNTMTMKYDSRVH
jgi:hypothetical protein